MASLVLGLAGAALGPSLFGGGIGAVAGNVLLGGAIGGLVGSVVDQAVIFPELFPRAPQRGPRLDSLELQQARDGANLAFCLGPENRVAGVPIWYPPLIEEETTEEPGGKGGAGAEITTYSYFAHVAVAVCEGPINRIRRIWADGKPIFEADTSFDETASTISAVATTEIVSVGPPAVFNFVLTLTSPSGGPDLSLLYAGIDVDVSGFSHAGNNGTWLCRARGTNTGGSTFAELVLGGQFNQTGSPPSTPFANESAGASVTIQQAAPNFVPGKIDDVRIYTGTHTQNPDPLIESYEGSGAVPGYRGWAYVVLEKLFLGDYGNRLPNLEFLVEAQETMTVAEAIAALMTRAGRDPSEYDVSALSSIEFRGIVARGPTSIATTLGYILLAYNIVVQKQAGVSYFVERASLQTVDVPPEALGAFAGTSPHRESPVEIEVRDVEGFTPPSEVHARYFDPARDWQDGDKRARRNSSDFEDAQIIDLPMTLTGSEALCIANRMLWSILAGSRTVAFSLPPSWIGKLLESDLAHVTTSEGIEYLARVTNLTIGANGIIEVEGVVEETQTQTFADCVDDVAPEIGGDFGLPPALSLAVMDLPALSDAHQSAPGIYLGIANSDPTEQWRGGSIFKSVDNSAFSLVTSPSSEVAMGTLVSALASGPTGIWDLGNTFDVILIQGALASVTEGEVLRGANWLLVGDEIVAVRDASLIAPRTYRCSTLIRGLRGTEQQIAASGHPIGTRVVVLQQVGIRFVPVPTADLDALRYFRALATGDVVANGISIPHYMRLNNVRPFAPTNVVAVRDGSNDLTFTWERRTRALVDPFSDNPGPLLEPAEGYWLHFYKATGAGSADFVAAYYANQPAFAYGAATRVADGFASAGATVYFFIAQAAAWTGVGRFTPEGSV